jgi:hypothetical protein
MVPVMMQMENGFRRMKQKSDSILSLTKSTAHLYSKYKCPNLSMLFTIHFHHERLLKNERITA